MYLDEDHTLSTSFQFQTTGMRYKNGGGTPVYNVSLDVPGDLSWVECDSDYSNGEMRSRPDLLNQANSSKSYTDRECAKRCNHYPNIK